MCYTKFLLVMYHPLHIKHMCPCDDTCLRVCALTLVFDSWERRRGIEALVKKRELQYAHTHTHTHTCGCVCVCVLQQAGGKRDRLRFNSHHCHLQQLSSSHFLFRGPVFALSPSWPPFKDLLKRESERHERGREGRRYLKKKKKSETDHWTVEKKIAKNANAM